MRCQWFGNINNNKIRRLTMIKLNKYVNHEIKKLQYISEIFDKKVEGVICQIMEKESIDLENLVSIKIDLEKNPGLNLFEVYFTGSYKNSFGTNFETESLPCLFSQEDIRENGFYNEKDFVNTIQTHLNLFLINVNIQIRNGTLTAKEKQIEKDIDSQLKEIKKISEQLKELSDWFDKHYKK